MDVRVEQGEHCQCLEDVTGLQSPAFLVQQRLLMQVPNIQVFSVDGFHPADESLVINDEVVQV